MTRCCPHLFDWGETTNHQKALPLKAKRPEKATVAAKLQDKYLILSTFQAVKTP